LKPIQAEFTLAAEAACECPKKPPVTALTRRRRMQEGVLRCRCEVRTHASERMPHSVRTSREAAVTVREDVARILQNRGRQSGGTQDPGRTSTTWAPPFVGRPYLNRRIHD
jgi:hypothetical protein